MPYRAGLGLMGAMYRFRVGILVALALSLALHAGLLATRWGEVPPPPPEDSMHIRLTAGPEVKPPSPEPRQAEPAKPRPEPETPSPAEPLAALAAPPAPTAEEWQLASTYTPRNSKRYRNTWAQQVRSMMGTAVAGPDQGLVRFRIEIAPDGKIAKVEELWSTSEKAAKLAWQAIRTLPPLPPTPTGKPLVFEQTLSFLPYETGWPPDYRLDCLPEPLAFNNPYAWDGASPQQAAERGHRPPPPEGCPPDSTAATIEEEERAFKRQMDQWRWGR